MIAGAGGDVATRAEAMLAAARPAGRIPVPGRARRADVIDAAFLGGTAAHGIELDDGFRQGSVHPGCVVVPAVLALGYDRHADGRALMEAIVAGYEAVIAIGRACHPDLRQRGFHPTAAVGVFGSAAAASKLRGLSADAFANALGLAASSAGGLFAFVNGGGDIKRLHAGHAAREGLQAALLAEQGVEGPPDVIEARDGFMQAFAFGRADKAHSKSARAALASEASGQRGHSKSARAGHSPEPGSSARARLATITLRGPQAAPPASAEAMVEQGAEFWPLKLARELDDAILDIRANEFDVAAIVFKSSGDPAQVLAYDQFLDANKEHWLAREIRGFWKRVLKRVDLTSRSLVALVEPGSCFAGTLAELVFASDRSYMLIGKRDGDNKPPATLALATVNFGAYPMSNGLSRLASRFLADPTDLDRAKAAAGETLDAEAAERLGLVTFALDDIDWEDEIRVFLEERASFSADGLTGLEANLRFGGPETMESKIFARLTAWQNWIFQRPNAVGEEGALKRYGTGQKPAFDTRRV